MRKERFLQIIIFLVCLLLILFSFLIGLWFDEFYLLFIILIVLVAGLFVVLELYLRIQANINSVVGGESNNIFSTIEDIKLMIEKLEYNLYNQGVEIKEIKEIKEINEFKEMLKRMAAGVEDLFDSQYEQTIDLVRDSQKEVEMLKKEISDVLSKTQER